MIRSRWWRRRRMRSARSIEPELMPFFWETTLSAVDAEGQSLEVAIGALAKSRSANAAPRAQMRFEPVRDRYGMRLALVFGNHAPGGTCPYYAGELCHHCDIGAGEGAAFDLATNRQRMNWFRDYYRGHLDSISHLVVYN